MATGTLRADAARNRARVLDAAARLFAVHGLEVTLDEIAREAGLGVGTVYRRFADREALVEALFEERMQRQVERTRAAAADEDPWRGLLGLLTDACEELATDRGMRQVMLSSAYGIDRVAQGRDQILPLAENLVARAKAAGAVRADFDVHDIPVLFVMLGAMVDFAGPASPGLWRRYFAVLVDGIRARPDPSGTDLPASLTPDQLTTAMHCWRPDRR